jgi:hypothetical protein
MDMGEDSGYIECVTGMIIAPPRPEFDTRTGWEINLDISRG